VLRDGELVRELGESAATWVEVRHRREAEQQVPIAELVG
jgi:hypothetical protein